MRVTIGVAVVTVVTAPLSYGAPLILTAPLLSVLLALLYAQPVDRWSAVGAALLGPVVLIGSIVLALRADEDRVDGVVSAVAVIGSLSGLIALRQRSGRLTARQNADEVAAHVGGNE